MLSVEAGRGDFARGVFDADGAADSEGYDEVWGRFCALGIRAWGSLRIVLCRSGRQGWGDGGLGGTESNKVREWKV